MVSLLKLHVAEMIPEFDEGILVTRKLAMLSHSVLSHVVQWLRTNSLDDEANTVASLLDSLPLEITHNEAVLLLGVFLDSLDNQEYQQNAILE